jgi:ABC-2 type transport system permease protein
MIIRWIYRRVRKYIRSRGAARAVAGQPAAGETVAGERPLRAPRERSPIELVLHQARYDLLAFVRNRQARFFTVALPILFLVIFVSVFGNDTIHSTGVKTSTYYVPGISALAVIAASFVNLVISITTQRESGVLKRRRTTPMPAWALIAARTLTVMAISLSVMAVVLVIGTVAYGVSVRTAAIPGIAITGLLGAATFSCLGYALSTLIESADAAQPTTQAITLPLYFISGVFVPNVNLPTWLLDIAKVFPVQHLADGLHRAFDPFAHGTGIAWSDLAILALWGVAGLFVALRRFSWTPAFAAA